MAADTVVPASDVVSRGRIFHYLEWGPVIVGAIGAAAISFVCIRFPLPIARPCCFLSLHSDNSPAGNTSGRAILRGHLPRITRMND
jgi:hypothetical protein